MDPRKRTVQAGYDELSPRFPAWMAANEGDPWKRFVAELESRLERGARILDLGCGSATKTKRLADSFDVVGVDISAKQLSLARENVPAAMFVQADLSAIEFEPGSFDAVAAYYSIIHVPREEHSALFGRIARWLRPGGFFLASLSAGGSEDWTGEWIGVEMFFSGYDAESNRRLLREAGFELLVDEVVTIHEPEGDVAFLWVLAQT